MNDRPAVDVVACGLPKGSVDIIGPDPHADPLHLTAAEWAEFLAKVKAGKYDHL